MAVPGWMEAGFARPVDLPVPDPIEVRYRDTFKFGAVSGQLLHTYGSPTIENNSGFRRIDITMRFGHVFDVALIDRIE